MTTLPRPLLKTCARIATLAGVAYMAFLAAIAANYTALFYWPDPHPVSPAAINLSNIETHVLRSTDGARLMAWLAQPTPGRPVVMYLHGKGGNQTVRRARIATLQREGFGVFYLSNRGFGGSSGTPSEQAIMADTLLAYDWLRDTGIPATRIVLFAESLGTHVAVRLAGRRPVAGIVLDSPSTSAVDVAAARYWYLPVRLLLQDQFDTMGYIRKTHAPLLVIHGERDPIVPYAMGLKVFAAANPPKRMITIPGGGHTVPFSRTPWADIRAFINLAGATNPLPPGPLPTTR